MAGDIRIELDPAQLRRVRELLDGMMQSGRSLRPVMRDIAGVLADAAERAFESESDPATGRAWPELAISTRKARARKGKWPGKMLQVSGGLAASVQTDYGDDYAQIGTNKVYGAIQQLGGRAGRGGRAQIPARPYLGVGEEDIEEMLDIVEAHFLGR